MGSRALSHDSIFLADQVLTDAEPAKVLSQENVHSKIKTLQVKPISRFYAFLKMGLYKCSSFKKYLYPGVIDEASAAEVTFWATTSGSASQTSR